MMNFDCLLSLFFLVITAHTKHNAHTSTMKEEVEIMTFSTKSEFDFVFVTQVVTLSFSAVSRSNTQSWLFPWRESQLMLAKTPFISDFGIEPVILFLAMLRRCKIEYLLVIAGIFPDSWFLEMSMISSCLKWPNSLGRKPLKLSFANSKILAGEAQKFALECCHWGLSLLEQASLIAGRLLYFGKGKAYIWREAFQLACLVWEIRTSGWKCWKLKRESHHLIDSPRVEEWQDYWDDPTHLELHQ